MSVVAVTAVLKLQSYGTSLRKASIAFLVLVLVLTSALVSLITNTDDLVSHAWGCSTCVQHLCMSVNASYPALCIS